jgi:TonB family protein
MGDLTNHTRVTHRRADKIATPQLVAQQNPNPLLSPSAFYDRTLWDKIERHWCELLNEASWVPKTDEKIVRVEFHLYSDGHVSDLSVVSSTGDEQDTALCMKAVRESGPFPSWPDEMTRAHKHGWRRIAVTFHLAP